MANSFNMSKDTAPLVDDGSYKHRHMGWKWFGVVMFASLKSFKGHLPETNISNHIEPTQKHRWQPIAGEPLAAKICRSQHLFFLRYKTGVACVESQPFCRGTTLRIWHSPGISSGPATHRSPTDSNMPVQHALEFRGGSSMVFVYVLTCFEPIYVNVRSVYIRRMETQTKLGN